jgi:hypothetical protein
MGDTTNTVQSAILKGLLSPWVALAFLAGFIAGYVTKALIGA